MPSVMCNIKCTDSVVTEIMIVMMNLIMMNLNIIIIIIIYLSFQRSIRVDIELVNRLQ